jgi:hypothetical protein
VLLNGPGGGKATPDDWKYEAHFRYQEWAKDRNNGDGDAWSFGIGMALYSGATDYRQNGTNHMGVASHGFGLPWDRADPNRVAHAGD